MTDIHENAHERPYAANDEVLDDGESGQAESVSTTIVLSHEDVETAKRLLNLLAGHDRPAAEDTGDDFRSMAKFSLELRQARSRHFSATMFREPAWDLLLALYVNEADQAPVSVSTLAKAADIPISTALRWIAYLEEQQQLLRSRSRCDRRASTVTLTQHGRDTLEGYFGDVISNVPLLARSTLNASKSS